MSNHNQGLLHSFDYVSDNTLPEVLTVLDALPGFSLVITEEGKVLDVFGSQESSMMPELTEFIGQNIKQFVSATTSVEMLSAIDLVIREQKNQQLEIKLEIQNELKRFECRVTPLNVKSDSKLFIWFANDITEQKNKKKSLTFIATHESPKGMANQNQLEERLDQENQVCIEFGTYSAFVFIDIDEFTEINDQHGRQVGDEILAQIAVRLESQTRQNDFAARLEGAKFALIFPTIGTTIADAIDQSTNSTTKIKQMLAAPILIGNDVIQLTVSIGIYILPQKDKAATDILREADIGIDQKRDSQKGYLTTFG